MKKIIMLILIVPVLLFASVLTEYSYGAERHEGRGGAQRYEGSRGGQRHEGRSGNRHYDRGHYYRGSSYYGGSIWISPLWDPWWWGARTYPYYSYYPSYYPYYTAPSVIQQEPSVYVQPAPKQEEESYWYFCPDPQGYYPYIKRCPKGWMKVVPSTVPPDEED